ncbi:hypothetical protein MPSEU_000273600 [Mayamaea pseudoterrestris]|nr:hypothetical protein MPSEU_000273600 [Mayamaea pseudoterrestris]
MSWFSAEGFKANLTGGGDKLKGWVTDKVISKETLEKLTLTTPELKEERERMDQEEKRKERVKDMLAGMLPWETRDSERDILVEECKEAILKLSHDKNVFFGPYAMPRSTVKLDEKDENDDKVDDNEDATDPNLDDTPSEKGPREPTAEQLERLKTLEPLPPLLQNFEIETHVGLIQKMLKEDANLSKLHSKYGVGESELTFWRNYFFHCAFCRYEAGLSIDEIWSENQPIAPTSKATAASAPREEETIVFKHPADDAKLSETEKAFPAEPATDVKAPLGNLSVDDNETSSPAASTTEYDMVGDNFDQDLAGGLDDTDAGVDYELDELEAEIARELEDC